jgi:hypothetical protein
VSLLIAITPKILEQNITRTEMTFKTLAEVDSELMARGLPTSQEIFKLDFSGSSEPDEAELVEVDPPK